ncbi:hypothetical protein BBD42_12975 [Paenibacillus sp. BIHB 4019]|uniref:Uncharacterized protein n=1 Tax=Paenibacillus sp. BIHB 4019 TaxID=1870819 RepID=A0A1B2DHV2_9BACL|nr:hypothetical protein [Paenibacillus sp. BIHB 4019]ANY67283.1 hypothetical protein BBD42_12975 [Paenibacillus sp. BIHB 4019]
MNAWAILQPQIEETIRELYYKGWDAEELSDKVSHPDWLRKGNFNRSPFAEVEFNCGAARFTLQGFVDIMDAMVDSGMSFADILRMHVLGLLRVEYEREVKEQEAQRELVWSHESVLGREIA